MAQVGFRLTVSIMKRVGSRSRTVSIPNSPLSHEPPNSCSSRTSASEAIDGDPLNLFSAPDEAIDGDPLNLEGLGEWDDPTVFVVVQHKHMPGKKKRQRRLQESSPTPAAIGAPSSSHGEFVGRADLPDCSRRQFSNVKEEPKSEEEEAEAPPRNWRGQTAQEDQDRPLLWRSTRSQCLTPQGLEAASEVRTTAELVGFLDMALAKFVDEVGDANRPRGRNLFRADPKSAHKAPPQRLLLLLLVLLLLLFILRSIVEYICRAQVHPPWCVFGVNSPSISDAVARLS